MAFSNSTQRFAGIELLAAIFAITWPPQASGAARPQSFRTVAPSCEHFSKASAKIAGNPGIYDWADKLTIAGTRFPEWRKTDALTYISLIKRISSGDNSLFPIDSEDMVLQRNAAMMHANIPSAEQITNEIGRGEIRAYVAEFDLDGSSSTAKVLRIDTLIPSAERLHHGKNDLRPDFRRAYAIISSHAYPNLVGTLLDPSGEGSSSSLTPILSGKEALWVDAIGGKIFRVVTAGDSIAGELTCPMTNPASNH